MLSGALLGSWLSLSLAVQAPLQGAGAVTVAEARCSIAVLRLEPQGLPPEHGHVPDLLTGSIGTELAAATGCRVVTEADIAQMLDFEAQKMACDVGSASCLAEIGGALGVEHVVAGSVGKLGPSFTLQLKLIDIKRGEVKRRVEETVGDDVVALRAAARNAALRLYDLAPAMAAGSGAAAASSDDGDDGPSALLLTGAAVAGVGLLVAAAGGVGAGVAEVMLGDATTTAADKGPVRVGGLVGLGAVGFGAVVVVVGAALIPFGLSD